ncbi:MAG: hypothetical protein DI603_18150 [Roseateles depolymerans]|uniref:Uncharacterized protein n=1 Tax=Roseateles depolymerans TaxID=76731 RepID=A0A2W5F8K0_9BURK|nr:MAG: hypothetical protein DI603_18150 [Roseateles depolymerans]
MRGFLLTFFTLLDERHHHKPLHEWLAGAAQQLGIRGGTSVAAMEGRDRQGKLHSAHFFELADQPIEVHFAATENQAQALFDLIRREGLDIFYVKAPVEFGSTGSAT